MSMIRLSLAVVITACSLSVVHAQKSFDAAVKKVDAYFDPPEAKRGQTVTLNIVVELNSGWHTYPIVQTDPESTQKTKLTFPAYRDVVFVGDVEDPPGATVDEKDQLLEYRDRVAWKRKAVVATDTLPGKKSIACGITLIVCDESNCLPPKTLTLEAELPISAATAIPIDATFVAAVTAASTAPMAPTKSEAPGSAVVVPAHTSDASAALEQIHGQLVVAAPSKTSQSDGLWSFLVTAAFWGAVALATPCVFPMIPITVSYFLHQTEKTHHKPLTTALIYCATIVVVLGVAAMTLLTAFRKLSVNPYMNIFLGLLFLFFSLSLFGMYDITLPSFLSRYTSEREGRGGIIGTIFMALTFTVVSFTCVAPFLGGFAGMAGSGKYTRFQLLLGALAFSTTFAAPFFFLALFPSLLKKLPKSGSWLNSVKVVMGFLEVAAALVFFRTAELRLLTPTAYFTYDVVLGAMIVLSALCGLYLLGLFRLHHDSPVEAITAPRLLLSLLFLGLAVYLTPALFRVGPEGQKQRPAGVAYAWIDSFLLPEPGKHADGLAWSGDLKKAIDESRTAAGRSAERQLIFIDFTGVTCKNCRINEQDVFTKDEIKDLFKKYRLVQLYTDTVPKEYYPKSAPIGRREADAAANLAFQLKAFGTEQLPLYVILEPQPGDKIDVVGVYPEGKINDVPAFIEFLRKPLEAGADSQAMK
jgi:thiol:disulfide interchange protein DsbD